MNENSVMFRDEVKQLNEFDLFKEFLNNVKVDYTIDEWTDIEENQKIEVQTINIGAFNQFDFVDGILQRNRL